MNTKILDIEIIDIEDIPSINKLYKRSKNGQVYMSTSGRDLKTLIQYLAKQNMKVECDVESRFYVEIDVQFYRNGRDIQNIDKIIFDALQGICFTNDNQVDKYTIQRVDLGKDNKSNYLCLKVYKI